VSDPYHAATPRWFSKGRMEAFSDGVIAIAITLLVLDLAVKPPGTPAQQFVNGWPTYLAYIISFFTIGSAWVAHNALTDDLEQVDTILLRLNLVFLFLVVFLPFPTRLVAEGLLEDISGERVATVVYGITLLLIRLMFGAMDGYTKREDLRRPGAAVPDLQEERRKFRFVVIGYLATIVVAFAVPLVAIGLYFLIAVALIVPFRSVALAFGRSRPTDSSPSAPAADDTRPDGPGA
jgi:uncharacterized membrane protein